jgi:hypothetical protein
VLNNKRSENRVMRSFMTCTVRTDVIRMIKSIRMRWAGNVARMKKKRNYIQDFG